MVSTLGRKVRGLVFDSWSSQVNNFPHYLKYIIINLCCLYYKLKDMQNRVLRARIGAHFEIPGFGAVVRAAEIVNIFLRKFSNNAFQNVNISIQYWNR